MTAGPPGIPVELPDGTPVGHASVRPQDGHLIVDLAAEIRSVVIRGFDIGVQGVAADAPRVTFDPLRPPAQRDGRYVIDLSAADVDVLSDAARCLPGHTARTRIQNIRKEMRELEAELQAVRAQLTELGATHRMLLVSHTEQGEELALAQRALKAHHNALPTAPAAALFRELVVTRMSIQRQRGAYVQEQLKPRSRRRLGILMEELGQVADSLRVAAAGRDLEEDLLCLAASAYTWLANLRGDRLPPAGD